MSAALHYLKTGFNSSMWLSLSDSVTGDGNIIEAGREEIRSVRAGIEGLSVGVGGFSNREGEGWSLSRV